MKALSLITMSLLLTASAFAGDKITCGVNGKGFVSKGMAPLPVKAKFNFEDRTTRNGLRILSQISGFIIFPDAEDTMRATFHVSELMENAKYAPRKYKTYSQFPNLNATNTQGGESGMWGNLVLEQNTDKARFKAHYIFQAGDHMGGTIHMTCYKN